MMKLVMIHYHLNRGGVTQVIASHLRALNGQVAENTRLPVALLSGGRFRGWPSDLARTLHRLDLTRHTVEELDYDNTRPHREDLTTRLRSTLQEAGFPPRETVLHVHNHSLGKNVALPPALSQLAREGYALLLHIHDFAEDFRPDNYCKMAEALGEPGGNTYDELPFQLYPQASQIHYAVLNGRDHAILRAARIDDARLHLLPNAVTGPGPLPSRSDARRKLEERLGIPAGHRFILYPVRGIRRKNLGEALLWSTLVDRRTSFAMTLPPLNPVEQPGYACWKELAAAIGLPWTFEAGGTTGLAYSENLAAADIFLTTSVAEGFGLVFLESCLVERPLIGRDLPNITADFISAGIRFAGLGPHFFIPTEWLDEEAFRTDIATAYREVLAAYGRPPLSPEGLDRAIDGLIDHGRVDFASCGKALQQQVIERVAENPSSRDRLLSINPWVRRALDGGDVDSMTLRRNAEIVRTNYSLDRCGRRLMEIYQRVAASDRDDALKPPANGNRILESFLDLSHFYPLRFES